MTKDATHTENGRRSKLSATPLPDGWKYMRCRKCRGALTRVPPTVLLFNCEGCTPENSTWRGGVFAL
jgi:hypothetical protein